MIINLGRQEGHFEIFPLKHFQIFPNDFQMIMRMMIKVSLIIMTMMVDDKPGKARGSLRDFSVEAFPNESGSENRSGSDTPKLQNIKSNTKLIQIQIQHL